MRALRVDIPRVHSDAWRTVWCPRCPRGSGLGRSGGPAPGAGHPAVATRAAVAVSAHGAVLAARGAEGTDVSPPPARISGAHARVSPPLPTAAGGGGAVDDAISLATKLPWWNDSIASLSMKFMGYRVAAASSKNFLVEDRSRELGARALAWVHGCIARIFVLRACVLLRAFMFMHTTLGFLSWYRVLCFRAALGSSATGTALYVLPLLLLLRARPHSVDVRVTVLSHRHRRSRRATVRQDGRQRVLARVSRPALPAAGVRRHGRVVHLAAQD